MCSATSSIEQMDMVDRVKGTPKACAARAALISPSAACIPRLPTGARATGIATGSPSMVEARLRSVMSTATRWRKRMRSKSVVFSRKVCSVQDPDSQ